MHLQVWLESGAELGGWVDSRGHHYRSQRRRQGSIFLSIATTRSTEQEMRLQLGQTCFDARALARQVEDLGTKDGVKGSLVTQSFGRCDSIGSSHPTRYTADPCE